MYCEIFSILFFALISFSVFLGLKLTGTIQWSWWFICSPIWGTSLACVFVFILVFWIEKQAKNGVKNEEENYL